MCYGKGLYPMKTINGVSLQATGKVCVPWGISVLGTDCVLWGDSFSCEENLCAVGRFSVV